MTHGLFCLSVSLRYQLGAEVHQVQSVSVSIQGWAKEWSLGCVNSCPAARGSQEAGFTQPRDHSFAQPGTYEMPTQMRECYHWGLYPAMQLTTVTDGPNWDHFQG